MSADDERATGPWTVVVTGDSLAERRPAQSILTVSDTRFGTRGVREEDSHGALPRVLAALQRQRETRLPVDVPVTAGEVAAADPDLPTD